MGGGMGGGSADAAAVLRLLDALAPRSHATRGMRELLPVARQLGADVPFLATSAPMALAWGHGDRMLLLPPLPQRSVALLFPSFTVDTTNAYASLDVSLLERRLGLFGSPFVFATDDLSRWSHLIAGPPGAYWSCNDFGLALARGPHAGELRDAMHALEQAGAAFGGMTGSGSTLFGIFDDAPDAAALERESGCRVVITRTASAVEPVHLSD